MSDRTTMGFRRMTGAVAAEVDGQSVLMSPVDLRTFGLNRTSAAVWSLLPAAGEPAATLDELVTGVLARFDVDRERAEREIAEHLDRLVAFGLVVADS